MYEYLLLELADQIWKRMDKVLIFQGFLSVKQPSWRPTTFVSHCNLGDFCTLSNEVPVNCNFQRMPFLWFKKLGLCLWSHQKHIKIQAHIRWKIIQKDWNTQKGVLVIHVSLLSSLLLTADIHPSLTPKKNWHQQSLQITMMSTEYTTCEIR